MVETAAGERIALDQRIARVVARPLARLGVPPNALTGLSMLAGLLGAWLYAQGAPASSWGAVLFILAAWMDHLDGEVARMSNRTSTFGHYFDHAAAMTTYVATFVGAGYGLRAGWLGGNGVYLGAVAGCSIAAIFSVRMWLELRHGLAAVRQKVRGGFEIEDTLYVLGPVTWLGGLPYFIAAAGVGAPIFLLYVVWDALRRERAPS